MPLPKPYSKINIEISNICNLQCSFCPEVIRDKSLMALPLFRRIIGQVAPLTEQVCFHLMGDPLVHPDLESMLDICLEHKVPVFLVSNGVLLNEKRFSLLLHPALRQVNFSLHSFADNFPERDPSQYLDRIFSYTEQAFRERPDLYINYRLWNLSNVRGKLTKSVDTLRHLEARFGLPLQGNPDVGAHKGRHLLHRLYLHFDTEFVWPDPALPLLGTQGSCYGLSSHFGILVDGTVVPCCLDKEGKIPLGNIAEHEVTDILNSPRAKTILHGFQNGRLVEDLCRRCKYIERFQKKRTPNTLSSAAP